MDREKIKNEVLEEMGERIFKDRKALLKGMARYAYEEAINLAIARTEEAKAIDIVRAMMQKHKTPKGMGIMPETIRSEEMFSFAQAYADEIAKQERLKTAREIFEEIEGVAGSSESCWEQIEEIKARWLEGSEEGNGTPFEKEGRRKAPVAGRRPKRAGMRGAGRK